MVTLTIANVPDTVRDALVRSASAKGRTLEAEALALIVQGAIDNVPIGANFDSDLQRAQDFFIQFRTKQSVVDELIVERRLEAWSETLKDLRAGHGPSVIER